MIENNGNEAEKGASALAGITTETQDMAACMDKFANTFEASARRWELIVYPSLLAFIVLAAYGFFLIYTLTNDVGRLARSMETVVVAMEGVAANMNTVSGDVAHISGNLSTIATDVGSGSDSMETMLVQMDNVNQNIKVMTVPIYQMRHDMGGMNHNLHQVAVPMKSMGSIFPF
jgi:uncharacterized protein YoxC